MTTYSREIPCKKCGKKGDTVKIWAGWYCQECLDEIQAVFDEKEKAGSLFTNKGEDE